MHAGSGAADAPRGQENNHAARARSMYVAGDPAATLPPLPRRPALLAFGRPLELHRPALCPELSLWLIAGAVDLESECRGLDDCHPPPYWAFCWGSGQALARYLLDHPAEVRGQRVVDFGAGSGIAGIAAARAGARSVLAVDLDPAARAAALANAGCNRVRLSVAAQMPADWDVLLAGDVLYEPANHARLLASAASGRRLLVSDPERPRTPRLPGTPLARYTVRTQPDVDAPVCSAAVFGLPGG